MAAVIAALHHPQMVIGDGGALERCLGSAGAGLGTGAGATEAPISHRGARSSLVDVAIVQVQLWGSVEGNAAYPGLCKAGLFVLVPALYFLVCAAWSCLLFAFNVAC
jgi:hypothetical protein